MLVLSIQLYTYIAYSSAMCFQYISVNNMWITLNEDKKNQ